MLLLFLPFELSFLQKIGYRCRNGTKIIDKSSVEYSQTKELLNIRIIFGVGYV